MKRRKLIVMRMCSIKRFVNYSCKYYEIIENDILWTPCIGKILYLGTLVQKFLIIDSNRYN